MGVKYKENAAREKVKNRPLYKRYKRSVFHIDIWADREIFQKVMDLSGRTQAMTM